MARRRGSIGSKRITKRKRRFAREQSKPVAEPVGLVAAPQPNLLLWNAQDTLVVQKLASAKVGDLPVDRFADLLCKKVGPDAQDPLVALRQGLIEVYQEAANQRQSTKAGHTQIRSARAALRSLMAAIERLDQVKPPRQRGLQAIFGGPLNDHKGVDELNNFAAKCWQAKLGLAKIVPELDLAINTEMAKPSKAGERKKRLRTLVEALAKWWRLKTGRSLAPSVIVENRTVVGRGGDFLDLARALFVRMDQFFDSEVVATVTNVHESGLRAVDRRQSNIGQVSK